MERSQAGLRQTLSVLADGHTKSLCPPSYPSQLPQQQIMHLLLACLLPLSFICYRTIILVFSHGLIPSQELQTWSRVSGPIQLHTPAVWLLQAAPEQERDSISRHLLEILLIYRKDTTSLGLSGAILENNLYMGEANTEENTPWQKGDRPGRRRERGGIPMTLQVPDSAVLEANPNPCTYSFYKEAELNF